MPIHSDDSKQPGARFLIDSKPEFRRSIMQSRELNQYETETFRNRRRLEQNKMMKIIKTNENMAPQLSLK